MGMAPNLSLLFLAIIVTGLSLLRWQYAAWMRTMRNEHAPQGGKFHVDRPALSFSRAIRNISLMTVICVLVAYALRDQFNLTFWQILFINVGFVLMYQDALFFGAPVTYIITASGIAIYYAPGHLDYRLFFRFDEIGHIERRGFVKDRGWSNLARLRDAQDGLLLVPKNPNGFSRRIQKIFLAPRDIDSFLMELPYGFKPL
jgi:hypothetical protein